MINLDGPRLVGVLGGTGMGKTTLLKAIYTTHPKRVKFVSNQPVIPVGMTVEQYLLYGAKLTDQTISKRKGYKALTRVAAEARVEKLIKLLQLEECKDFIVSSDVSKMTISHGQRARASVGFFLASATHPLDCLLIDEPLSSLDLKTAIDVSRVLHDIVCDPESLVKTIVFSVHQPPASVWRLLDHVVIVHRMKVIYAGPKQQAESYLTETYSLLDPPTSRDPATRLYDVIARTDEECVESWPRDYAETALWSAIFAGTDSKVKLRLWRRFTSAIRRMYLVCCLCSRNTWLASRSLSFLYAPVAFMLHGIVLGFILRKDYEKSVPYSALRDAPFNQVDLVPTTLIESESIAAFSRMWTPDQLNPFSERISRLRPEMVEEEESLKNWPYSSGKNTINPILEYMKRGPHHDGRIDALDGFIWSPSTLKFAHRLIHCVRDNIDLYWDKFQIPEYHPKYPEWFLPLKRDPEYRNNIYDAPRIPEELSYLNDDQIGQRRALQEEGSAPEAASFDSDMDWTSSSLTADIITTELMTLLQMLDAGLFEWSWTNLEECQAKKNSALNFYMCLLKSYPERYQSVIRCLGVPQIPILIPTLPIPDPVAESTKRTLMNAEDVQASESSPSKAPPPPRRNLLLNYDEHWPAFVGLRKLFHSLRVDFLDRILIRLLEGVVGALSSAVCIFFLVISSGFFALLPIVQWNRLRQFAAQCSLNRVIGHSYEFMLSFVMSTWLFSLYSGTFIIVSFMICSGQPMETIPVAVLIYVFYLQALSGYLLFVNELVTPLHDAASISTVRVVEYILVIMVELSGFFIRPSNYPSWCRGLRHISPYKWATEAMNLLIMRQDMYTSKTLVPQEVNLAIAGTVSRSVLLCVGVLTLQWVCSLTLALILYHIRVFTTNRFSSPVVKTFAAYISQKPKPPSAILEMPQ